MHFKNRLNPVISAILFILLATFLPAGCGKEEPEGSGSLLPTDELSQKAVLMKLYEATNGDSWANNLNWGSDLPLQEWFGIRTINGYVTEINLPGNHLDGYLPDEIYELPFLESLIIGSPKHSNTLNDWNKDDWNLIKGELSPKIGQLTNLKILDFQGLVDITCGDVPDELWMPQIEKINLHSVSVKGRISPAIGNATNLKYLDIKNGRGNTDLRGTLPTEIAKLKKLEFIYLEGNKHLTGTLPENIGDMESLQDVRMGLCALTGTIPESIFNLKNLYSFDVRANFIEGEFDLSRLIELPKMDHFAIPYNMCLQGTEDVPKNIRSVWFNRDNYDLSYEYGEVKWAHEPAYYSTPEELAERLKVKEGPHLSMRPEALRIPETNI